MLYIFFFGLTSLGVFLMVSSFSIFARNKSMIEIPSLFIKARKSSNSKYRFHTQLLSGIMLLFYSAALYDMGVSFLPAHLLAMVITYIAIDGLGYLKFIG